MSLSMSLVKAQVAKVSVRMALSFSYRRISMPLDQEGAMMFRIYPSTAATKSIAGRAGEAAMSEWIRPNLFLKVGNYYKSSVKSYLII